MTSQNIAAPDIIIREMGNTGPDELQQINTSVTVTK